ncbi:hypothetical protein [Enterobacter cloacae complex sp. ESBL7]|uniref:hypothetical protein n=1 Tax=Enterobacter cloacae complex sp. ESBL7 TaxID=3163325 RepID=UPI003565B3F2
MPVWLDAIPEKAAKVRRPDTRRWLLFLAFVMLTGIILTFWRWTSERTGFVFWFTALGLPFCCWGLIFSVRRFGYKIQQVAAESRNVAREALIDQEIRRGQRCAWILATRIQLAAGNKPGQLLSAISKASPVAELSPSRGSSAQVNYAAMIDFRQDFPKALDDAVNKLSSSLAGVVKHLPRGIACWLALDCDTDLESEVKPLLINKFLQVTGSTFHLLSERGAAAFDFWLDQCHEVPGILVAVTFSLPSIPRAGEADAVTMMVLCNRKSVAFPDAPRLHRPEKGRKTTLVKTLNRALLWAGIDGCALQAGWSSGPLLETGASWNTACEENGLTYSLSENNVCFDSVLGYCGQAALWVAAGLAEAVCETRGPQLIAAQPAADIDEIWVMVITKEKMHEERQGNV